MNDAAYIDGMETIIYFVRKKGLSEPLVEPIGMKTYLLVRVSLDMDAEKWCGIDLHKPEKPEYRSAGALQCADIVTREQVGSVPPRFPVEDSFGYRIVHPIQTYRRRREENALRQQECQHRFEILREYHLRLEQWKERVQKSECSLRKLAEELAQLQEPGEMMYAVYEDDWQENFLWYRHITILKFKDYDVPFWIKQLLPEHLPYHIVIIGKNWHICSILEQYSARLKSIRWFLPEREYDGEFREYLESFYEEYGLVISCRTYSDVNMLRRETIQCQECAIILDFTGDSNLSAAGLCRGSMWVDIYSIEAKQKKIEGRYPGVTYFSLKSVWKQIQKSRNLPFILDSPWENGYNTWESEGIIKPISHRY